VLIGVIAVNRAAAATPVGNTEVTFRIRGEPETLDWTRAHTVVEAYLLMNIMEGLVTFDAGTKLLPALAQSWNISKDGKVYTFKIRPNVLWSDGVPLTAEHFVYSWKRLLSPVTAAAYAYLLFDIQGAEGFNQRRITDFNDVGIKALDSLTLQVTLSHPVAHWIYIPAFWTTFPMRQDIVEKYGVGWDYPGHMVNLGPFSLVTHDADSKIVLRANPKYYGPHGNVSQVTALVVKDDVTALKLYQAGKLDFLTDLATVDLHGFTGSRELRSFSQLKTGFLGFAIDQYPLSNTKLRRAIAMAIDKSKLCRMLHGGQEPATSFVPPGMLAYSKSVGLPFNREKAREELNRTGLSKLGPIRLDYALPNWDKAREIAEFIQGQLKENLGIEVLLHSMDNLTYRTQLDLHTYPLYDYTWTADYPDPDNFLSLFSSESGNSRTGWKDDLYDGLVFKGRQVQGSSEREKIYLNAQKDLLEEEAIIVPLYYEPNLVLVKSRIKSFEMSSMDYLFLRKVDVVQ